MLRRLLALIALASCSATTPLLAAERFTPPFGGAGGRQFISRCPPGTLMTGVATWQGAYINGIAAICDGRIMPAAGGPGNQSNGICPNGSIVGKVGLWSLRSSNHLLKWVLLFCFSRLNNEFTGQVNIYSPGRMTGGAPYRDYPHTDVHCGNQRITGLQGRAGAAIDAVGLICN